MRGCRGRKAATAFYREACGIGMAPELVPRVFDLFTRGDRTLAHTAGGLGVGLTIVHNLVELHGGTVSATSEGPGRGGEFVVRLPIGHAAAATRTVSATEVRQQPPLHILVIEDNADMRELLRKGAPSGGR
jgi:light-regulated signal transduction histidine kinase (bacteriophytochrome)